MLCTGLTAHAEEGKPLVDCGTDDDEGISEGYVTAELGLVELSMVRGVVLWNAET